MDILQARVFKYSPFISFEEGQPGVDRGILMVIIYFHIDKIIKE